MMNRTLRFCVIACSLLSTAALATDLKIDGFASTYYGQVPNQDELTATYPNYLGYGDQADFQQDTLYGIQFRGDLDDDLSVTAQIVGRGNSDYDAILNWAYFTYNFTDEFSVKAGRQRIAYFMYSDFIDVGYAYHWISPPNSTYGISGFDNVDGVNFEYFTDLAGWTSRLNLHVGKSRADIESSGSIVQVDSDDFFALTWNMNYDWFTFQIMRQESRVTLDSYSTLASAIDSTWQQFLQPALTSAQIDLLDVNNDPSSFTGFGVSADTGDWLAVAEYTLIELDESPVTEDRASWYVSGGYRWDDYTISLTYENQESPNTAETLALLDGIQGVFSVAPSAAPLNAAIDAAYRIGADFNTTTVGFRYDFHPSAAFKIDYSISEYEYDQGRGTTTDLEPHLVRMGVDLVF